MDTKLDRAFYLRTDPVEIAKELLGKYLVRNLDEGTTIGKIVEVEAYMGTKDAAAHSYKGIITERIRVMFGEGGHAYVYMIYGMYYCFNIVTNGPNVPYAILVRALEPIEGIELMQKRINKEKINQLCNGPGKLCKAMAINKSDNGIDLCGNEIYITEGERIEEENIIATPRINIDYSGPAKDYLWRFIIKDSLYISRKK